MIVAVVVVVVGDGSVVAVVVVVELTLMVSNQLVEQAMWMAGGDVHVRVDDVPCGWW
jgi:hypothetical protein